MDDLFFHTSSDKTPLNEVKCCANCKHIDWRPMLVSCADETYHGYKGKTKHEVIRNVLSNYVETVARYLEDDEFEWTRKRKERRIKEI